MANTVAATLETINIANNDIGSSSESLIAHLAKSGRERERRTQRSFLSASVIPQRFLSDSSAILQHFEEDEFRFWFEVGTNWTVRVATRQSSTGCLQIQRSE